MEGREELFEREQHQEPVTGSHTGALAFSGINQCLNVKELLMVPDKTQISDELSRLITLQTEFYKKSDPTPEQVQEFELSGKRIRELFAELAQNRAA
jgi:hypothetical protein